MLPFLIFRYGRQMYYNYYVHILQSQYFLHLVELELHTLKIVYNSIRFWSFVPNFLPISLSLSVC